jgi:hypothetical protein
MKKGHYIFELNGIRHKDLIDEFYPRQKNIEPDDNANVTTLIPTNNKYIFYDLSKGTRKLTTMVDILTQKYVPMTTDKPCWWCKYEFSSCPIGAPLKYHQSTSNKNEIHQFLSSRNLPTTPNDYFETEGIFCSLPCCKAYLVDHRFNTKYKNSFGLLTLLCCKLYGSVHRIPTAPSWKLLERWSGPLTIEQFRQSFGKFNYYETPNIKRPFMFTVGNIIEEVKTF